MKTFFFIIAAAVLTGCEPAGDARREIIAPEDCKFKLAVIVDMSPSFASLMADQGQAYQMLLEVVDRYLRDTIGSQDRIILAQISGKQPALIWDGTSLELRQQFDPPKFAAFLHVHSEPMGSPVYEVTAETLEYMMADPAVESGKTTPILLILSDMQDTSLATAELKDRLLSDLRNYGKVGGTLGIYFCDQERVARWKKGLADAGIKHSFVESGIVTTPTLPNFE
jgi:hypothetical protein